MSTNNWQTALYHETARFGAFKYDGYVERASVIGACKQALKKSNLIALKGEEGLGKTTLLFALEKELGNDYHIIPFITALSARAQTQTDMLKYFVYCLEAAAQCFDYSGVSPERALGILAAKLYDATGKETLLLIDDPARLVRTSDAYHIPDYIKVIFTSEAEVDTMAVEVPPLDQEEAKAVLGAMLDKHGFAVGPKVVEAVLAKACSGNAAFLELVAQRLSAAHFVEKADEAQLIATVNAIPDNLRWSCYILSTEAGEKTSFIIQKGALALMSASRFGLKKRDIRAIFEQGLLEWNEDKFSALEQYLRSYFYYGTDETIRFSSPFIQDCLHTYFGGGTHEIESQLLHYLKALSFEDGMRLSELIYHARIADDRDFALNYIASISESGDKAVIETAVNELVINTLIDDGEWLTDVINTPADRDTFNKFAGFVFKALCSVEPYDSKAPIFNKIYRAIIKKLI